MHLACCPPLHSDVSVCNPPLIPSPVVWNGRVWRVHGDGRWPEDAPYFKNVIHVRICRIEPFASKLAAQHAKLALLISAFTGASCSFDDRANAHVSIIHKTQSVINTKAQLSSAANACKLPAPWLNNFFPFPFSFFLAGSSISCALHPTEAFLGKFLGFPRQFFGFPDFFPVGKDDFRVKTKKRKKEWIAMKAPRYWRWRGEMTVILCLSESELWTWPTTGQLGVDPQYQVRTNKELLLCHPFSAISLSLCCFDLNRFYYWKQ